MIVNNRQDQTVSITNDQLVSAQKLVDTYSIIITNRGVIEPIMKNLNIEEDYEDFIENISVKALNNTQVMSIKVKNPDPQVALEIVTQIVQRVPEVITSTIEAGSVNIVSAPYVNAKRPVSPSKVKNTILQPVQVCLFCGCDLPDCLAGQYPLSRKKILKNSWTGYHWHYSYHRKLQKERIVYGKILSEK